MKILMLTPYLPYPPSSGGQVRSYNLLKHLSKHHDIYLVSLIKNNEEKKYHKDLLPYCKEIYVCMRSENPWTPLNIIKSVFGRYPFLVVRNYSRQSQDVISNLLKKEQFDLIHAETFYIMPHIPQTNVPILLVEQTIEYQVYQHFVSRLTPLIRPLFYFDIHKLKYWEIEYWKRADLVGAVSQEDKKQMSELMSEQKIEIIPNGAGEDLLPLYKKIKESQPIFLYQGNFSWLQNVEAADILVTEIFPEIKRRVA
ncbi:MAG: glycosyltransferase, partial [Candidatus Paceibacterota bacterium]